MTGVADGLLEAVDALRVWQRGDQRAPHKPLLVLLMLGRLGQDRLAAFEDVEEQLRDLLRDFGPPRRSYHPEFPFWHLRSDGIWEVPGAVRVQLKQGSRSPSLSAVRELHGGFTTPVWEALRDDPRLVRELAERLLAAHFPASLHEDIVERVGLADLLAEAPMRRAQRRDPRFRITVLRAYEHRCAVCGFDGRLDTTPVGLDAAHVRWWAAGGPDTLDNALALCVLHHKALDLGVIGISADLRVQVAQAYHGGDRAHEYVTGFAGAPLLSPQRGLATVSGEHVTWHEREVFRKPPRVPLRAAADDAGTYDTGV